MRGVYWFVVGGGFPGGVDSTQRDDINRVSLDRGPGLVDEKKTLVFGLVGERREIRGSIDLIRRIGASVSCLLSDEVRFYQA